MQPRGKLFWREDFRRWPVIARSPRRNGGHQQFANHVRNLFRLQALPLVRALPSRTGVRPIPFAPGRAKTAENKDQLRRKSRLIPENWQGNAGRPVRRWRYAPPGALGDLLNLTSYDCNIG